MGITLPYTFVSGAARTGAEVQANLETVRKYINGRIVQTDVPVDTVNYRHIERPEHFGRPTIKSQGVTADLHGRHATIAKEERACASLEVGGTDYICCPELSATVVVYSTSWVRVRARFYAWGPYADVVGLNTQAYGVVAYAQLFVNDTGMVSTRRRIVMHDYANPTAPPIQGIMPNDKKDHSYIWAQSLAAGTYDFSTKIRTAMSPQVAPSAIDPINDGAPIVWTAAPLRHLYIETRTFTVEVDPTF